MMGLKVNAAGADYLLAHNQVTSSNVGGSVTVFDYPNSDHAFFNDDRPEVYNHANAALAWQRSLDFFKRNLH